MSKEPLKPCCRCKRVLTRSTYCPACALIVEKKREKWKQERAKERRAAFNGNDSRNDKTTEHKAAYNNSRWAKASRTYRQRNPLCAHCLQRGITTPATCVDHIIPHNYDWELFWDSSNWQALCWSCHSIKTSKERGGWGKAGKRQKSDNF